MTTPKAKFAGLVLIAVLCAGVILGLTVPAWAAWDEGGQAYQRGDYPTALRELRPLARQGDANAQLFVGLMYDKGQGVPQDYAEAAKWYRKAAEQGYAAAQYNLGIMYYKGRGVPQDYVRAHMWINLAAATGDETAREDRDLITKKMTPAQIAEAQKLARRWGPKKFWWQFWR